MTYKVLVLAGDGIGEEIMSSTIGVLKTLEKKVGKQLFEFEYDLIGGCAYEKYGEPLAEKTLKKAKEVDAVLLGAVGGYKWDNLPIEKRPEKGLLKIRKEMGLYANIRPVKIFDDLVEKSPLKKEIVAGTDIVIVRELIGGFTLVNHGELQRKTANLMGLIQCVMPRVKLKELEKLLLK